MQKPTLAMALLTLCLVASDKPADKPEAMRWNFEDAQIGEPAGKWHTIRVVHRGSAIQVYLSGKLKIEAQDDALKEPGKIGLWSKADAVSSFDDVRASVPKS